MTTPTLPEVADAVTTLVNTLLATLSAGTTAVRTNEPRTALKDLGSVAVTVVPVGMPQILGTREGNGWKFVVDVAVQRKTSIKAEQDAVMNLGQRLAEGLFHDRVTVSSNDAVCVESPLYNDNAKEPTEVKQLGVFTVVVRTGWEWLP